MTWGDEPYKSSAGSGGTKSAGSTPPPSSRRRDYDELNVEDAVEFGKTWTHRVGNVFREHKSEMVIMFVLGMIAMKIIEHIHFW